MKLSPNDASRLDLPITVEEIKNAIMNMYKVKASGPDALPIEFYKENINRIGQELLQIYEEALSLGTLRKDINVGLIKLIPKDGDRTLIKN